MPANVADSAALREKVRGAYSDAAEHTDEKHAFPVGRQFAESLGYPAELLNSLPAVACDAFAGVSNVSIFADLPVGATVLDLGCGSGTDTLIAAQRVGKSGKVIGVDFSASMLSRARQAVTESDVPNIELRESGAEGLPMADGEIDVAIVNGIFNLNPAREAIFRELARVIKPSGNLFAAELILRQPLPPETRANESDWFAWIAGAKEGDTFLKEFKQAGFSDAVILRVSRNARTKNPLVLAAEVSARKWTFMSFYRERIYPHLVSVLGNPKPIADIRQRIVPLAHGHVLEIGVGTGTNFPLYDSARVQKVYALEPNKGMLRRADEQRSKIRLQVEFLDVPWERIPLSDASVDTVVSTFTLCTIPGVADAIQGLRRVLKPGGKFIFFEHGLSPDATVQLWQVRSEPLFRWAFEGCHLTRDVPSLIRTGGFAIEQIEEGYVAPFPKSGSYCWWGVAA